jgi:arsenite methyltransferase
MSAILKKSLEKEELRESVRRHYAKAATGRKSCCGPDLDTTTVALQIGYKPEELSVAPSDSNLGLGCGNPIDLASLKKGEMVLDLGCGAGFDVFLAAKEVGPKGRVIGVDMTPEMLAKSRENGLKIDASNVEFRLGEIEHLPVGDASIDVIISNCVINLSPDKPQVFAEAFRVLKPEGRLAVSDIVLRAPLSDEQRQEIAHHYADCAAGASTVDELQRMLTEAGFKEITVKPKDSSKEFIKEWSSDVPLEEYIASASIEAIKPG